MSIADPKSRYNDGNGLLADDHLTHATGDDDATQAEIAEYISEITAEIATMARDVKLDMLAYFLTMARLEAELKLRDFHTRQELVEIDRLQTKSGTPRSRKARRDKRSG